MDVERDIIAAAAAASAAIASTASAAVSIEDSVVEKRHADEPEEQGYVYDLYVVDETQPQVHIPFIPDNLDDIRLVLVEDLYYTFFSYI